MDGFGLMDYNARYYDPLLGRFISPDSIIPQPGSPLAWDRFAYTLNNPLTYVDPSGHSECNTNEECDEIGTTPRGWGIEYEKEHPDDLFLSLIKDPIHSDSIFIYGGFGDYRGKHPVQGQWYGLDRWHASIDVGNRNNVGIAIYAIYPGRVVAEGWDASGFGNYVVIEHSILGEKYYSVYGHLGTSQENSGTTVGVGDWVSTDTQIGSLGNSLAGYPDGAKESDNPFHLHFEIRRATNINLSNPNPLSGQRYWAYEGEEWPIYFVDLGLNYGYAQNETDPAFPTATQ